MFRIFWEERWCMAAMLLFFVISIANRLFLGIVYENLIREAENMAVTRNATLKRWKTKFIKCFQLNGGVNNVPIFVEKCMSHLAIGNFSFEKLDHYSGQALLFSIIMAGIGICRSLAGGESVGQVIPFYLACFVELYLYFSISAVVNIKEKQRILKIYLVDYLENHLSSRVMTTQNDLEKLGYVAPDEKFSDKHPMKMRMMEGVAARGKETVNTRKKQGEIASGQESNMETVNTRKMQGEIASGQERGVEMVNKQRKQGEVACEQKDNGEDARKWEWQNEEEMEREDVAENAVMCEEWEELIREIMTI